MPLPGCHQGGSWSPHTEIANCTRTLFSRSGYIFPIPSWAGMMPSCQLLATRESRSASVSCVFAGALNPPNLCARLSWSVLFKLEPMEATVWTDRGREKDGSINNNHTVYDAQTKAEREIAHHQFFVEWFPLMHRVKCLCLLPAQLAHS